MTTTTLSIRYATPDDAIQLSHIHRASWTQAYQGLVPDVSLKKMIQKRSQKWWRNMLGLKPSYLTLEHGGKIIGYASFGRNRCKDLAFNGELYELYMLPEYQGLGFGRHLFKVAVHEMIKCKMHKITAWSLEDNVQSNAFLEKMGGMLIARGTEKIGSKDCPKLAFGWSHASI